jgi:hypothetical protein
MSWHASIYGVFRLRIIVTTNALSDPFFLFINKMETIVERALLNFIVLFKLTPRFFVPAGAVCGFITGNANDFASLILTLLNINISRLKSPRPRNSEKFIFGVQSKKRFRCSSSSTVLSPIYQIPFCSATKGRPFNFPS